MNWLDRLKLRWALRGTVNAPVMTGALPGAQATNQHAEETADQKWKREHGFSAATTPLPWSEDIAAHNKEVHEEYNEEIEARKRAYLDGTYVPQFLDMSEMSEGRVIEIVERQAKPGVDEINWHLEMTARPGARTNVTKDPGVKMQPILTEVEHHQARMEGNLLREVAAVEKGQKAHAQTARDIIGSRAAILAAVGGREDLADQIEASAKQMLGVEDLDAPLAGRSDA